MSLINLKIVSPEKKVFEQGGFYSVTLPTESGEITVLPGHIPLISKVVPGEIIARNEKGEESLITLNGFLKLDHAGNILILSDYAIRSEDVEIERVQEAKKKAEETLKEKGSDRDFIVAEAELKKTLLELKVAQRRKSKVRV